MAKINWSALSGEKKDRTPKDTSNIFKLTKDEHLLRIIPFPLKSKHFDAKYFNEENNVFVNLFVHKSGKDDIVPYRDDKATLALDSFGKDDPITTFGRKLWYDNNKGTSKQNISAMEIAKQLLPERPTYCCVIDREEENPVPKLWKITKFNTVAQLFAKAEAKMKKKMKMDDEDELDWTDVNEGYDITVNSVKSSYNGFPFFDISSIVIEPSPAPSPVCESKAELNELYAIMPNPFDLYHIVSFTDLEEILDKNMRGDDDEDEDDTIKAKPKSVAKVTKKVLIEDDEDEDDEEEETPAPKTKTKAKAVSEDDEDDVPVVKSKTKSKAKIAEDDDEDDEPVTKTKSNEKDFGAMFKGNKKSLPQDNTVPF